MQAADEMYFLESFKGQRHLLQWFKGTGLALRLSTAAFFRELETSAALRKELKHYLYVVKNQFAQTAGCNRFHVVKARLARWLLMTQDRAHSDQFHITQVFLAYVLGVRRVGITKAANSLQKKELIRYKRICERISV